MLLAMATGTGKTKLAIAMLYRLLAAKRFRRVVFRRGPQRARNTGRREFSTTRIVSAKTFADIFGLKGLDDVTPDPETKVHICTIQGLVKRVLFAQDARRRPPVDQYDLMVVDECHRGYLLDRELSDAELSFRNQDDYISKYRRVLEYFDAVKIGLTATPALHTVNIFGDPVFKYSYREAVIDGYLDRPRAADPDHDRAQPGRHQVREGRGDRADRHPDRQDRPRAHAGRDQVRRRRVQQGRRHGPFNSVVAEELARHIDPNLPGKTLIFAVSDAHADIVVDQLKKPSREAYGEIEDAAVRKITGSVDRPGSLIRSYRNDALPKIAVTVDLLTTGIDVPASRTSSSCGGSTAVSSTSRCSAAPRAMPGDRQGDLPHLRRGRSLSAPAEPHRDEAGRREPDDQLRAALRGIRPRSRMRSIATSCANRFS